MSFCAECRALCEEERDRQADKRFCGTQFANWSKNLRRNSKSGTTEDPRTTGGVIHGRITSWTAGMLKKNLCVSVDFSRGKPRGDREGFGVAVSSMEFPVLCVEDPSSTVTPMVQEKPRSKQNLKNRKTKGERSRGKGESDLELSHRWTHRKLPMIGARSVRSPNGNGNAIERPGVTLMTRTKLTQWREGRSLHDTVCQRREDDRAQPRLSTTQDTILESVQDVTAGWTRVSTPTCREKIVLSKGAHTAGKCSPQRPSLGQGRCLMRVILPGGSC